MIRQAVILFISLLLGSSQAIKSVVYVQSGDHLQYQQDGYDLEIQSTTQCPSEQEQTHAQQFNGPQVAEEWQFMDSPIMISMKEIPTIKLVQEDHHSSRLEKPSEMLMDMPEQMPIKVEQHLTTEKGFDLVNNRFLSKKMGHSDMSDWTDRNNNWIEWRKVIAFHPSGQQELVKQRKHHLASKFHLKSNLEVPKLENPIQSYQPAIMSVIPPASAVKVGGYEQVSKEMISEPPQVPVVVVMSTDGKKGDLEVDELEQQEKFPVIESVMLSLNQQPLDSSQGKEIVANDPQRATTGKLAQLIDSQMSLKTSSSAFERVKESLLNAADVARILASRASSTMMGSSARPSVSTAAPRLVETNLTSILESRTGLNRSDDPADNTWQVWSGPTDQLVSGAPGTQLSPIFLGFGQLQRIDPFNGNERTQARLSCQFGDERARNMSISQVEWARFVGTYNANEVPPGFNCQASSTDCTLVPIKTDTLITVHPRPAVQRYIDTLVPSYSMTLHDINQDHLGTYRCSAVRQMADGLRELVYRVIPLE